MLEFANAQGCTNVALAMQHFSQSANSSYAPQRQLRLRMGVHLASFVTDQHDICSTDMNLTALLYAGRAQRDCGDRRFALHAYPLQHRQLPANLLCD